MSFSGVDALSRRGFVAAAIGLLATCRHPLAIGAQDDQGTLAEFSSGQYFPGTGHNLRDPFLSRWQAFGGEPVLGQPLSEERYDPDYGLVQTFQTMTLVYDPGLEYPWDIQGVLLDPALVEDLAPASARKSVNSCSEGTFFCQFFAETGHTISGGINSFWSLNGGLPAFGMPLSEPFKQKGVSTQVFERAVLEDHGNDKIQLVQLAAKQVEAGDLGAGDPAFSVAPPTGGETHLVGAEDGLRLRTGPSASAEILVTLPSNAEFISERGATGDWIGGYADGYSGWVSSLYLVAAPSVPKIATEDWNPTIWQGATLSETNVREQPTTQAGVVQELSFGSPVVVEAWVKGEAVFPEAAEWAQLENGGGYIYARNVGRTGPVEAPPMPANPPIDGSWIDANLTQQLLTAYEGTKVIHVCEMTSGMAGFETPPGNYQILTRYANETMTDGSIGAEGYYRLEDVLFTQYFTNEGHAIHFAWWRTPETIGRPGSHGCLNLLLDDSRFFWDWAFIGCPVIVH